MVLSDGRNRQNGAQEDGRNRESTVKREMWNKWTEYCEVLKGKW